MDSDVIYGFREEQKKPAGRERAQVSLADLLARLLASPDDVYSPLDVPDYV